MARKNTGRAAQGSGTIRKKTVTRNGQKYTYWEARVTIGKDLGTGKQIQKSFSGKSQKEVREKMQAAAVAINENDYYEPGKMTVKQWFEIWFSEYSSDKKPLTIQQYKSMATTHIYPALGSVQLSKLTAPQVQKFYNDLAKAGMTIKKTDKKTGKTETRTEPLSAKTIRNIHGIFSKALNVAIDQGLLRNNVAERVTLPKVVKKEIKPLTEEQQKAFLAAIKIHMFCYIYTVILFTGLREGEAIGLTWDCIDFKAGRMKIYRQLQRIPGEWSKYRFVPLKNSKARVVQLSPYVLDILKQQRIKQLEARFKTGDLWQGWKTEEERKSGLVFTNEYGENINTVTLYNHFKKIAAEIGIPDARLHDLRHTFAVISLQNGDDFKTVQDALGHATAAFTLDVYGHVSERMKEESAKRQQAYIESLQA